MAIENPKPWNQDPMFRRLTTRLNTYRNHRNQIRQLEMMDDRELADMPALRRTCEEALGKTWEFRETVIARTGN